MDNQQIQQLSQLNDIDSLRKKCIKKINKILDKDQLTEEDIQLLNQLNETLKCCCGKEEVKEYPYTNTKEDFILLKNLFCGTEFYEDYHLLNILRRAKLIMLLLEKKE